MEERRDRLDVLLEHAQRLQERATLPGPITRESYEVGHYEIHVHFGVRVRGSDPRYLCARFVRLEENNRAGEVLAAPDETRRRELLHEVECPVLVGVFKPSEQGERMCLWIRSTVRLQSLDQCLSSWVDAPDLLRGVLPKALLRPEDREGCSVAAGAAVSGDELPGEVVESSPQVMKSVADDTTHLDRQLTPRWSAVDVLAALRIEFAGDQVRLRISRTPQAHYYSVAVGTRPR